MQATLTEVVSLLRQLSTPLRGHREATTEVVPLMWEQRNDNENDAEFGYKTPVVVFERRH